MGREVKRVALYFDWPLRETWKGFLNPYYGYSESCTKCDGTGYSDRYKELQDMWYGKVPFKPEDNGSTPITHDDIRASVEAKVKRQNDEKKEDLPPFMQKNYRKFRYHGCDLESQVEIECTRMCAHYNKSWGHHLNQDEVQALIDADRLQDFTHDWSNEDGWTKKLLPPFITPREVNLWSLGGVGHDSLNSYVVLGHRCKKEGQSTVCSACDGEGSFVVDEAMKKKCDEWKDYEPPAGDAYQIWETVGEGSPVSPPFATPIDLARWMAKPGNDDSVTMGRTVDQWMSFIDAGWAPTGILGPSGYQDGVTAVGDMQNATNASAALADHKDDVDKLIDEIEDA